MTDRLPPFTADILRELMNIGGAHATTALAKMSHDKVFIDLPEVALLKLEHIPDFVGASQNVQSMTIHPMAGEVNGFILFSYGQIDASSLAKRIREQSGLKNGVNDAAAILNEIGNILSGSCIRAINQFLGISFSQTIPDGTTDMSGAILGSILAEIGQHADDALITRLSFREEKLAIDGNIYLLFDPDSTQIVLHAAKKKITAS